METNKLTKAEQKWYEDLKAVMKRQPKNIFIYCSSDEFNLMRRSDKLLNNNLTKGYDSSEVIATVNYIGDCGAW